MAFDLERFLSSVNGGRTLVTHRTGETVYSQGDRCDVVFYVRSGKCKVSVISDQGKEAIVALHAKGDFFGEGSLTGQPLRLATVMAMTDLELLRFDLASMRRALQEEPFSELFIAHLLARNARVEADLVDQLFNSSEKRLARILFADGQFWQRGQPEPVIAKISQETLAEMIGTTRSRVSVFMNKFRKLGFIEYNGDLKVHNSLLNVILHDAPGLRREPETRNPNYFSRPV